MTANVKLSWMLLYIFTFFVYNSIAADPGKLFPR
jgi:hypothetical protein